MRAGCGTVRARFMQHPHKPGWAAVDFHSSILSLQFIKEKQSLSDLNCIYILFCDSEAVVCKVNSLKHKKIPPLKSDSIYGDRYFDCGLDTGSTSVTCT